MVRASRTRMRPSGVRGPGLRPPCMRQRSLPWIAGERQWQPARVRAPQRGARWRFGLPRGLAAGDGGGNKAAGSAGVVEVRAASGIAVFLAVYLTNMADIPNKNSQASHLADR